MLLRTRIINALVKRDGTITKSQITRLFDRIKDNSEQDELKLMAKEGLIDIVVKEQKEKTGLNPTIYNITDSGQQYYDDLVAA